MKFGVNTFIWTASFDRSNLGLLPSIREAGFDGVEVPLFRPAEFDTEGIRQGLAEHGLECTVCSILTGGLNLIDQDANVRAATRAHLEACIETTAAVGATILAGPLYSPVGHLPGRRRTADEWNWAVEAYRSLGPALDRTGVTLAIEPLNRFETYFLNTAADAVALCEAVGHPRVGILLDTFHANIEEKDIAAAYRVAAPHLKHVHTCENDRGTPGSGHVDWAGVFAALHESGYNGWLTIESFGFALGDLSAAASIWRDLAASPEAIAFDGVRFLRSMS
ncbi:MAG: sugar phosphate isomerase/epimerase [Bryobacterales bacterium]|nr:sugar phosphate isomerase/epimerase [Bryobacterales bacterium]